ncbi:MAG: amino acid ABC transporter ATP-binding protein [Verrucomicrobiae bacterium]|nr:amino acid ABC transporter ATP-binding protein [Verrucomicrobiae bacterium]
MNIELTDLTRRYGEAHALRSVSYRVPEGVRVLVLIGPSGGGKSTLLRMLGGLDVPDAGEIRFDATLLSRGDDPLRSHRRQNGFLFQAFNLFPHLTALENVTLPLTEVHDKNPVEAREIAMACLERFRLGAHHQKRPAEMSGGQQQRVALARALAHQPRLLILDEPTSALDPEMTAEVLEVIEGLCRDGQEIILSTHEMGFARAVADEIVFLADGEIVETGSPEKIFDAPDSEVVRQFLGRVMRY